MKCSDRVTLVEVAPRDGFQSVVEQIPLQDKFALIKSLVDAGLTQVEVGAFVSPKAIPQMADIEPLLGLLAQREQLPAFDAMVLVPNLKGALRAIDNHCRVLNFVFSASETHNLKNVGKTLAQSLAELALIQQAVSAKPGVVLRVSIATSFDCPFDGKVDQQHCLALLDQVLAICPQASIALCDTTGRAHPFAVSSLFTQALSKIAVHKLIFHCHDTYGFGIANIAAAYTAGARIFDSAVAGFGGCPFAPGASGNVATEDVVYFFEQAGIATGVDWQHLKLAISLAEQIQGAQLSGHLRSLNVARY